MSFTQTTLGTALLAIPLAAALGFVLPDPKPIVVHSLTYAAGVVHQERTVTAEDEVFHASWAAVVMDADTETPVEWCSGAGSWPYTSGRIVAEMPLPRWTGADDCTPESLPRGRYYLRASWFWGDDQTSERSDVFVIE